MENVIIEILRKGNDIHEFTSEIAEMMTAFIEWWMWGSHPFVSWMDEKSKFITDEIDPKRYTLDELFNYWYTEIYKKQKP